MRDLQGIAEINGPRLAELQAERAANIEKRRVARDRVREQQIAHGKRVEARQAQKEQK